MNDYGSDIRRIRNALYYFLIIMSISKLRLRGDPGKMDQKMEVGYYFPINLSAMMT